jgi:hypothetical protein
MGDAVEFTDLSENDPTSWEWSFEGGTPETSVEQNPSIMYEGNGVFDVSLTATNPYGSDTKTVEDYITVDTLTFVNSYGETLSLKVFPNPVSDKLYLTLNKKSQQEVYVAVFDINGKLLFTKELTGQENEINMGELKAGVYILKIITGNNSRIFKVTKR